jgi:hypothetical protein
LAMLVGHRLEGGKAGLNRLDGLVARRRAPPGVPAEDLPGLAQVEQDAPVARAADPSRDGHRIARDVNGDSAGLGWVLSPPSGRRRPPRFPHLGPSSRRGPRIRFRDTRGGRDRGLVETQASKDTGVSLDNMGFDKDALDDLVAGNRGDADETEEDEVPDVPTSATTRPGDIWCLGDHRLLCGDSWDVEQVRRLLEGVQADAVTTDPPYGVSYVARTEAALTIKNDDAAELRPLLYAALGAAKTVCRPGAVWCVVAPSAPRDLDFAQVLSDLEPFAGSGTTLITCQQVERVCRAIELAPVYVDVIVKPWENLTSEKAHRLPAEMKEAG